ILQEEGYSTGAVVAGYPVVSQFGLDQGFETYDDSLRLAVAGTPVPQRLAETVSRRSLDWIRAQSDAPWFFWAHYFDPHDPYTPPEPWKSRFAGDPYDGEMSYTDSHVGGLVRELKRLGLWDRTFVVLVGDHGEGLGDHNEMTHSLFIYNTTIAAPLIMKFPHGSARKLGSFHGRRVPDLCASTDIVPTVLSFLDLNGAAGELSGKSLIPVVTDTGESRRTAYMETLVPELDYGWSAYFGLREGPWKLILSPNPELYHLGDDPGETRNLYDREPERAEAMHRKLLDINDGTRLVTLAAMDQETVEALQSLGYVGGGGGRAAGTLKDAKTMGWALRAFDEARSHSQIGDSRKVIESLQGVLRRDATNRFARRMLSYTLLHSGYTEQATDLCRKILKDEPKAADRSIIRLRYAEALMKAGRLDDALHETERLLDREEPVAGAHLLRARIYSRMGEVEGAQDALQSIREFPFDDPEAAAALAPRVAAAEGDVYLENNLVPQAEGAYQEALETSARQVDALTGLAEIYLERDQHAEAGKFLRMALSADPTNAEGHYLMGRLLNRQRKPKEALAHFERAVRKAPGVARYRARLGNHLFFGGMYRRAIEHLKTAVQLGSQRQSTYAGLGMSYARLEEEAKAREALQTALEINPDSELAGRIQEELSKLDL
ncbi:MAG: tetratricopeptide repeat protein, partial [Candidatus Eisenbacteria bacterium]|nr:tetratricopeptide repeat protein [Candidatus Eisenbacteria bacterium]